MFDNKIDVIKTQGELPLSHHTFQDMKGQHINQSEKALLYTCVIVFIYLVLDRAYTYY